MSISASITRGFYRGKPVTGVFPLVKPFQEGARGGFITVENPTPEFGHPPVQRISVKQGDFTLVDINGDELGEHVVIDTGSSGGKLQISTNYEQVFMAAETEDEAMERLDSTFKMLDRVVDAAARNIVRGLVVSGPPGIGKSFGVEKQLDTANMMRVMAGMDPNYEIISGGVSSIGLYQKLYFNRNKENVLVFDDSDGVLFDEESLSLLKAALNSGERRRICWNKESRILGIEGIPDAFDFEGSILFLTNIDFEQSIAKGSRISAHLEAIMSRCHYLDLEIGSLRDKLLVIKLRIRDGMLNTYDFTPEQEQSIVDFVFNNAEHMREISLRSVKKVADFVKADPDDWYEVAEATLLMKEAKFKRLQERRNAKHNDANIVLAEEVI